MREKENLRETTGWPGSSKEATSLSLRKMGHLTSAIPGKDGKKMRRWKKRRERTLQL